MQNNNYGSSSLALFQKNEKKSELSDNLFQLFFTDLFLLLLLFLSL